MQKGGGDDTRRQLWERQTPSEPSHLEPPCDKGRGPNKTGVFIRHEVGMGDKKAACHQRPQAPTSISNSTDPFQMHSLTPRVPSF